MGNEYEDNRKKLVTQIRNEPSQTPIQEVRPVEPKAKAKPKKTKEASVPNEDHITFWGPSEMIKWVKIYSVSNDKSIKQVCLEALEDYRRKVGQ